MTTPGTLHLDGELTIQEAAAQRQRLLEALGQPGDAVQLDLSRIHGFDSAGVQLLLALRRSLVAQGRALRLEAAAPCVLDGLHSFGLATLFGVGTGAAA